MRQFVMILLCLSSTSALFSQVRVVINVEHVKSDQGAILVAVYQDKSEYPKNPFRTYSFEKKGKQEDKIQLIISDLKPGDYGFAFLDDENRSGDMDYNRLGLPQEGYGFGNNVRPFLRTPAFERCVVKIRRGENVMNITIR